MTPLRFRHAVAICALSISGAALLPAPAQAATAATRVEGEQMSATTGRAVVFADPAASGGSGLKLLTNATVEGSVLTPVAQRLTLRLRGDQFDGAPQAVVRVDDQQVAALPVPATGWTDSWSKEAGRPGVTRSG